MSDYRCPRCAADPRPRHFASDRRCAFLADGAFTPHNWNCATLDAVMAVRAGCEELEGSDESMQIVYSGDYGGWLVFTRYKHRGCTSSAMHVGDFYPPQVVTLKLVEQFIAGERPDQPDDDPEPAGGAA